MGIVLPAEGDLVMLESQQTVVRDGHAMGVAGEITQHMVGAAERWLGIDHPVLPEQGAQEGTECFLMLERLERTRERKMAHVKSSLQTGDELSAEDATEDVDG
jgi:hypothetical protein